MTHVLVSGANGFVGRALVTALALQGHSATRLVRRARGGSPGAQEWVHDGVDFAGAAEAWPPELRPECAVHLAARVHVMHDSAADPEAAFRAANVEGTLRLAKACWQNGVRRFVFVSSIKAVAESDNGHPLREDDPAHIEDAYGRSKREAEEALSRYGQQTGMEVVIVRPPLVYGQDVRANFLRLMDAIWNGIPLPLGAAHSRRSLIYVGNLADALVRCATDARAAGQCFHVTDGNDPTVTELVEAIGRHLQKPARLFPIPASLLRVAGRLTRRSAQVERLIGSLQVDTTRIRHVLGWTPPFSIDDGLAATASWYRSTHSSQP
jgi:nucleoside-diphosphate-sugar epimerase